MNIEKTNLEGVLIVTPDIYADERGMFMETFSEERYREMLGLTPHEHFVQDNLSVSKKGVLRGLHYQAPPMAQGKLVSVPRGRVLDVAVDIRAGSPTYGEYVVVELSGDNHRQLWIPRGFAHGFITLEDDTLFAYKCTNAYSREHERGIVWNDPALGIDWGEATPIVSEKDKQHPLFVDIPKEFVFNS